MDNNLIMACIDSTFNPASLGTAATVGTRQAQPEPEGQAGPSFADVLAASAETPEPPASSATAPEPQARKDLPAEGETGANDRAADGDRTPCGSEEAAIANPTWVQRIRQNPIAHQFDRRSNPPGHGQKIESAETGAARSQNPAAGTVVGKGTGGGAGQTPTEGLTTASRPQAATHDASAKAGAEKYFTIDRVASPAPNLIEGQQPPADPKPTSTPAGPGKTPTAKTAPVGVDPGADTAVIQARHAAVWVATQESPSGFQRPSLSKTASAPAADRPKAGGTATLKSDSDKPHAAGKNGRQTARTAEPKNSPGQTEGTQARSDESSRPEMPTPSSGRGHSHPAQPPDAGAPPAARVDTAADSSPASSWTRAWAGQSEAVPADVLRQVVDRLGNQLRYGQSELRLALKPEALGHLDLKITNDQTGVSVRILAETVAAKELIETSLGQLRTDLSQQGLDVKTLDVDVFTANDQPGKENNPRQSSGHSRVPQPVLDPPPEASPVPGIVSGDWDSGGHNRLVGLYV